MKGSVSGGLTPDKSALQNNNLEEIILEIKYQDIILRDMMESDIDDWIHWFTRETSWMDWDGPDLGSDEPFDPEAFRRESMEMIRHPWEGNFRNFFELDTVDGHHIGAVSSYATGPDFQHLSWKEAKELGQFWFTLGIDICDSRFWGKGLGRQALAAFCGHFIEHGKRELRLQTWSGNVRMVRCAEKIGFVEVNRFVGNRHIRGGVYDGLTFQLDEARFAAYLAENP